MRETALFALVFDEGKEWKRGDDAIRDSKWADRVQKHLAARPALVGKLCEGLWD